MRAKLVERLAPFVAAAHSQISDAKEKIELSFSPGNENDFAADLARSRKEEARLRQTIVGPHRDDVDLSVDEIAAQIYASEGQQRTLALALKIAQARVFAEEGAQPLLLIDDIFGELDPDRRNSLLACLPTDSQKLVTATTLQWCKDFDDGVMFGIKDKKLQRR
jgi:DNA replication and repair protein RecF